jgi:hypothetical protein
MSNTKTLAAAALVGLLSGGTFTANAHAAGDATPAQATEQKSIEKHACKGQNSCKGNGGGDKAHYGKNSCKGKGSCATDGSKPAN